MTERVQINLERMIPELEEYKNKGVFTAVELKKIITTRKKHEYRLQRFDKKLLDILRYIESETTLENIINRRVEKKKLKLGYYDKKVSEKIVSLYEEALFRFNDKVVIVKFTEYAIMNKLHEEMKRVYANYCLKNSSDAELWIFCAIKLFEIEDVDSSRALFLKAIRLNPKYHKLRVEFFRMEILNILRSIENNKLLGIEEEITDEHTFVAYNIYLDTIEVCKDTKYISEILDISKEVDEVHKKITEKEAAVI